MKWPIVALGDCGDIQGGLQISAKRSGLPLSRPYLRVANVHRGRLDLAEVKTIQATQAEVDRTQLEPGDLLFVEGHANPHEVGRVAVWDGSVPQCLHQNHLIRFRPNPGVLLPEFAVRWFNSPGGARHFQRFGKTTSGLNTISTSTVRSAPTLLPPLDEQRRLANILEKAATIGRARDFTSRLADGLVEALFFEMFGEESRCAVSPNGNRAHHRGWHWAQLNQVAELATGHTPDRNCSEYWDGSIPWLSLPDIRSLDGETVETTSLMVTEAGIAN